MTHDTNGPVVVGVDFSAPSQTAIDYAAWQAEQQHRDLLLIHGHDNLAQVGVPAITGYDTGLLNEAEAKLSELCKEVAAAHPDLKVSGRVRRRSGAAALVDASETAALVVVASRGHGVLHQFFAGSVASQTTAHAACPVVVVRPPEEGDEAVAAPVELPGKGPVLVGVDGSTFSSAAVEFAFAEASRRGVPVVAVSVWSMQDISDLSGQRSWREDASQWQRRVEEDSDRVVAEAVAGLAERYPEVLVQPFSIHDVSPYQGLLIGAHQVHPDLIVVGSRGIGGFAGLLLGSVSQRVVNYGPGSIAVVHSQQPSD
jgi:nucleotide-binding universal stress UspA family protein